MKRLNVTALSLNLLSKTLTFKDKEPRHPDFPDIGIKRVVSIVIHENGCPELGLADNSDSDQIEYYHLDRLLIFADSEARSLFQLS